MIAVPSVSQIPQGLPGYGETGSECLVDYGVHHRFACRVQALWLLFFFFLIGKHACDSRGSDETFFYI